METRGYRANENGNKQPSQQLQVFSEAQLPHGIMGRKKRKIADDGVGTTHTAVVPSGGDAVQPPPPPPPPPPSSASPSMSGANVIESAESQGNQGTKTTSSGYAMTTHSAEIVDEDLYVSEGSEDDDDDDDGEVVEMVLAGSRMGIMRRGIHHPMLMQPNRQWTRQDQKADGDGTLDEEAEQKRLKEQEEELAKLDPAQRAARLLAEKQKKLEEAKVNARRLESEENAGRDPCLFSKRTAFDIRFDQIDDKPWTRGAGDLTDFFNYGLTEDDWLDYAQQQLMIRQELTDANRQRRPPDPTVVPVTPRTPSKQTPKVAVAASTKSESKDDEQATESSDENAVIGPVLVKKEQESHSETKGIASEPDAKYLDVHVGVGGAWGAGAAPGSMLAKLIEEQERKMEVTNKEPDRMDMPRGHSRDEDMKYGPGSGMMMEGKTLDRGGWQEEKPERDWADQGHQSRQNHPNHHNRSMPGHMHQQQMPHDWNNRGTYGQSDWNQNMGHGHGGSHRGRGYYGGGGSHGSRAGRGGRGGHGPDYGGRGGRDRPYQSGSHRGGDHHQRKRPRDEYDNRWRR